MKAQKKHSETEQVRDGGTFHPSAEPLPMGHCDRHRRLHVQREDCQGFERATSNEIAEDTFARF